MDPGQCSAHRYPLQLADMKLRLVRLRIAVLDNRNAMVDFPSSGTPVPSGDPSIPLPQHLPFRRISFPTSTRNIPIRPLSVVSTASFDSDNSHLASSPGKSPARGPRNRPLSVEANKRVSRRREVKSVVIDEQRDAKRRKIINEFYETERTYVEGLDLIYSVSLQLTVCLVSVYLRQSCSIFLHQ